MLVVIVHILFNKTPITLELQKGKVPFLLFDIIFGAKIHLDARSFVLQGFFEVLDSLNSALELMLFENDSLLFFIDALNGCLNPPFEEEAERFESILYIGYFSHSESHEISILSAFDFFPVNIDFVIHQHEEMFLVVLNLAGRK